ncbi:glycosyltransferase family 2 protein [Caulobacter sp. 17J65-9]|uniref:glycosyltransferase family 2 protein n=1 Tax=Caulobacter sp. 17J65-9 TaxID=2709382 RepID=UPI0013C62BFE|nr:glycosyltransferase family 2 protein [Caulobacter sp. 17J65-9]NEX91838.1 glycosyltransferase family 2 protein [Caulobacter sp. 17J65-9]
MTQFAQPAPVTCYIRTQNEERMIGRVIEAAKAVADEIVVVDSGSSDRTIEIAESLGARVIRQPWLGNGPQKRVGEDAAKHDWLLDLDADEILTPKLAEEIRQLFAHGEPPKPIYEFKLITAPPVGEPWWDFLHAYRRKLYDRRVIRIPDHKAWDQFEVPSGVPIGRLKGDVLHYSFRDFAHVAEKMNKVSTVRSRESKLKARWQTEVRVWFGLPFYFFKHFIMRGLWRGGTYGVVLSALAAHGRWLRDAKMYEIHLNREAETKKAAREERAA